MKDIDKRAFQIWADTDEYDSRVLEARSIVRKSRQPNYLAYLAYSGGKDSTAMLHLIHDIIPDIHICLYDLRPKIPDVYFQEILDICHHITGRYPTIWPRISTKGMISDIINHYIPDLYHKGYRTTYVGLRRKESLNRKHRIDNNIMITRIPEVWPLRNWSADDVWAYIVSNGIKYHSYYDNRGESDITDIRDVRFSVLFHHGFTHIGAQNLDCYHDWRFSYEDRSYE